MRITAFLLAMLLGGCAADGDSEPGTESVSQAIIGGSEEAHDASVVALMANARHYCSGTLIAPRTVLTAAHCLRLAVPTEVRMGPSTIAVAEVREHPRFNLPGLAHDVGIVFLASDGPGTPASLSLSPRVGERVRVVGFGGEREGTLDPAPTKRSGFQRIDRVEDARFRARPDPAAPCGGDSGGAVLNERGELVGVISAGDRRCRDYALATRVDTHRDFIDGALGSAEADGCAMAPDRPSQSGISLLSAVLLVMGIRRRRMDTVNGQLSLGVRRESLLRGH